jgi:hypothetical protein
VRTVSCPSRSVLDDGRIKCDKIALGDHDVSPAICEHCPAPACDCQHLRFSLEKITLTPITVRRASGHVEVWDDQEPRVSFLRSACALKTTPVTSPADCLACCMRLSWMGQSADQSVVTQMAMALGDNVIPFVRPPRSRPGVSCTSS